MGCTPGWRRSRIPRYVTQKLPMINKPLLNNAFDKGLAAINSSLNTYRQISKPKLKLLAPIAFIALTGCATNQAQVSYPQGMKNNASFNRSDPLGAYLASRDFVNDIGGDSTMAGAALNQLGIKYKFGGNLPSTGFDCSGLVSYAAATSLGLKLPRRSAEIARLGQQVNRKDLQVGDLVFFNTLGRKYSHVGIYLGDQKFVHAPRAGSVVRIEDMTVAYWNNRYNGARRLDQGVNTAMLNTSMLSK